MNVLFIGCHPDDIEIACGGTAAKCAKRGDTISFVVATDGRMGSFGLPPDEIAEVRRREAEEAASLVGARLFWLGFPDQGFFDSMETRLSLIDAIRQVVPDFIITHFFPDYFSNDHNNVGLAVNAAATMVPMPNVKTTHPHLDHNPPVYFFDNASGIGFNPEEYVDITDFIETKREMIKKHKSQQEWLDYHCGATTEHLAEIANKFRGSQIGVEYAEAFIRCKAWARGVEGTLLPVGNKRT